MIVVIIIAILASIAFGSYQHHVVNTRRAAAAACLQERTQRLERFHTLHLSYMDAAGNPPVLAECGDGLAQHYQLGLSAVSARAFTLQAVPQGAQAKADTRCGTLTINQLGVRAVSGTANATPGECW
jgi:type IV pilus assembly protein PilE